MGHKKNRGWYGVLVWGLIVFGLAGAPPATAQSASSRYLAAGTTGPLPQVTANDNRTPAGTWVGQTLELALEAVWGDWRIEGGQGPGLRVVALAEAGQPPMIPAPLIRVEAGTRIRARIHNTLADSTLTVFGLQTRPARTPDSLVVRPGETKTVAFEAGAPGTYFYYVLLGDGSAPGGGEREHLAGAFIVDPKGGSPPDRVFMINIFSTPVDTAWHPHGWLEALTINGRSWPETERLRPAVGDTVRWRVINASNRNHPMHLHGFFYDVTSRGTALEDDRYAPADRRKVVTEMMRGRSTMAMAWVPTRPGNWLFHCHLSYHVAPNIRLPGADGAGHGGHRPHMAGLVLGIEVQPGPTDLVSHGPPRHLTLYAKAYPSDTTTAYGFALDEAFVPDEEQLRTPGPVLLMRQYEPTYVTVRNALPVPTGVHWHGLELDSWADGVPGWSASDGQVSPVIAPGEAFTYKLSLMRPGTFIYHTHLDDVRQLTSGLYGALIVLGEGETYDPATDHIYIVGWNSPAPQSPADLELNGRAEQPVQHAVVGETHRIRVINIAPAGMITARMVQGEQPVPLRALAKDGADLPVHQQVPVEVSPRMGVGETADFTFTPEKAGTYELVIGYRRFAWRQPWVVRAPEKSR